jgi:tetratricopeptide (TPR) repeat protein
VGLRWTNVAILAALVGFVLHNLVEYTLWTPAAAMLFWVAGATVAGQFLPAPSQARGRRRASLAVAAALALFCAGSARAIWRPVYERSCLVRQAAAAWNAGAKSASQDDLAAAVAADRLDGNAPAALASVEATLGRPDEAVAYAQVSFQRSPTPNHATLLTRLLWRDGRRADALQAAVQAVYLDPMDVRLRLEYAAMLVEDGQLAQAAEQVRIIRQIDRSRPADSDLRLTGKELAELDALARRAGLQEHP